MVECEVLVDVVVRGKNRPVPAHLKALAQEKVARIARFTHDAGRVEVDFSELKNPRVPDRQLCEITVHLKKHFVKAHASSTEPEAALDLAVDKVEHQVARIKERRVARNHVRHANGNVNGNGSDALAEADLDDDIGDAPRIAKRKRFATKPMDPEEAALQMELLGHAFFLFTNTENGRAAVLYRRNDGDLGLIETTA
jgi:putative sigma-54 modulation protein